MKLICCLLIICLFPIQLFAPSSNALRFCSYNTHRFTGDINHFQKIKETLQNSNSSVEQNTFYNFQEVMNDNAEKKLHEMILGHYRSLLINSSRPNLTLFSGSLSFFILEKGIIKTNFVRNMPYVIFKIAGFKILSVNCHWPSQFHHFNLRLNQARLLKKFLIEKISEHKKLKIIVSGDFNLKNNEITLVDFYLRPVLFLVKNDSPTYYYSRKKSWNYFDLFWTNFCHDQKCISKVIINAANSTIGKYKNGEIYLRPKKNFRYEKHQDRQGPSDHFPLCFELPI